MSPVVEQYQVALFSKPFLFSWTTFLTPLPKVKTKSFAFVIEPFDPFIWDAILASSVLLPLVLLAFQRVSLRSCSTSGLMLKFVESVGDLGQVLLEQSLPESRTKAVAGLRAVRWLLLMSWLLASIVLCSVYKSVVVSVLIKPELEQPPSTFRESVFSYSIHFMKLLGVNCLMCREKNYFCSQAGASSILGVRTLFPRGIHS